jgi:hypothetical protein
VVKAATSCSPTAFSGPASFTYTITTERQRDSHRQPGGQPVNDAPVANADMPAPRSTVAISSIAVLANDTDGGGNP